MNNKERLTAYALGELSGAAAQEIKDLLERDAEARRFVEEVRAFAQFAERDLRSEPLPGGHGAGPLLAEAARRSAGRPSPRRVWLQAAALGAVIALFTLAVPLREKFGGQLAKVFSLHEATRTHEATDEERPTQRTRKEDATEVEKDFDEFATRARVARLAPGCAFTAPAALAADRLEADSATYLLPHSGLRLDVTVRARLSPLVREAGVEEVAHSTGKILLRRALGDLGVAYYVVNEKPGSSYCEIQVSSGRPPEPAMTFLGGALDGVARAIAESTAIETP